MWKLNLYIYFELSYLFVPVSLSAVTVTAVNISNEKSSIFSIYKWTMYHKMKLFNFIYLKKYNKNNDSIETNNDNNIYNLKLYFFFCLS